MNIWIFNHYAHTPDLPGGTRHYDLGRELVERVVKMRLLGIIRLTGMVTLGSASGFRWRLQHLVHSKNTGC